MSQFPTNKTVPLDKDIAVSEAKPEILGTGAREQLSVVLDTIDQKLKQEQDDRIADVDAEETRALAAEADLQQQINTEIADRIADVNAEEARAIAAEAAEASTRLDEDAKLKGMIDGERAPLRITSVSGTTVTIASARGYRYDASGPTSNIITPNGAFVSDFEGATINFATGTIDYVNPSVPDETFAPISFSGNAGKWAAYTIVLLPGAPNTLLVIKGDTFGSSNSQALIPAFSGGIPICGVAVQDTGSGSAGAINPLSLETSLNAVPTPATASVQFLYLYNGGSSWNLGFSITSPSHSTITPNASYSQIDPAPPLATAASNFATNFNGTYSGLGYSAVASGTSITITKSSGSFTVLDNLYPGSISSTYTPPGMAIIQSNIWEILSSGSGTGGGDFSPLEPNPEETFVYYTRSDFLVDGKKFFMSTTGLDQVLGLGKITLGVGGVFTSKSLTGPQHKLDALAINTVQGKILYANDAVDEAVSVEFSRNGGASWSAASINLPGSANAASYVGNIIEANLTFVDSNPLFNGGTASGTYSSGQRVAAMFTPSYDMVLSAFTMQVRTNSTSGTIVGKLMSVTSGTPQSVIATAAQIMIAAQDITSTVGSKTFSFAPVTLTAGTQYALVVEGAGLTANLEVPTVSGAPAFSTASSAHNGSGWVASASNLAYTVIGSGCDLRIRITSGTANSQLKGFGVNYVSDSSAATTGAHSYEERVISSTEASTGNILFSNLFYTPGAHQLMCLHDGKVYMAPDFTEMNVNRVKFPSNFFNAGDVVRFFTSYGLVDGTSEALSRIAGLYHAIIGSSLQVSMRTATHTSLSSVLATAPSGAKILVLAGSHGEALSVTTDVMIEGQGRGTELAGNVTVSGNYATIKNVKFGGNLTVTGSGNFIKECFAASASTISDTGSVNKKEIIQE